VIRPKDFEELFDTDADLSGYDLDVSPYIRDGDDMSISLFWRAVGQDQRVAAQPPRRDELCAAPLSAEVRAWLMPKNQLVPVYVDDPLSSDEKNWIRLDRSGRRLRPGLILLLDVGVGGYDHERGFIGVEGSSPVIEVSTIRAEEGDADSGATIKNDPLSFGFKQAVLLDRHLGHVAECARKIAQAIGLPIAQTNALTRAGAWHDLGKVYGPFQTLLGHAPDGPFLAKSAEGRAPHARRVQAEADGLRKYFRHELASTLAFLQQHDGEPDADLVAFLIAAHHGKVRMGLRALPEERPDGRELRIARGVQDGDLLPDLHCGSEISNAVKLDLGIMEMGEDEHGRPSWSARTHALLAEHGPFRLAYLEALIRMADWRASEAEQQGAGPDE
jgi:CRISPR-associated endonuclease/helicase Cas3